VRCVGQEDVGNETDNSAERHDVKYWREVNVSNQRPLQLPNSATGYLVAIEMTEISALT
jgi:hypothetical protein